MSETHDPINLSDLVPAGLPFVDSLPGGGDKTYMLRAADDLSPRDFARLRQLQQQVSGMYGKADAGDPAAAQAIADGIDGLMALIAPDWPAERIASVSYAVKMRLIERWEAAQPRPPTAAQARAAGPTPRGKRSRASAPPTGSALAK